MEVIKLENEIIYANELLEENNTLSGTTSTVVVDNSKTEELLTHIDTDLQSIICFLVFFTLVILLKYVYKFFDMFFVI